LGKRIDSRRDDESSLKGHQDTRSTAALRDDPGAPVMNVGDERSRSLWMDIEVADNAPALDRAEHADTVVIGAGICRAVDGL
jgi:hypothetical protein